MPAAPPVSVLAGTALDVPPEEAEADTLAQAVHSQYVNAKARFQPTGEPGEHWQSAINPEIFAAFGDNPSYDVIRDRVRRSVGLPGTLPEQGYLETAARSLSTAGQRSLAGLLAASPFQDAARSMDQSADEIDAFSADYRAPLDLPRKIIAGVAQAPVVIPEVITAARGLRVPALAGGAGRFNPATLNRALMAGGAFEASARSGIHAGDTPAQVLGESAIEAAGTFLAPGGTEAFGLGGAKQTARQALTGIVSEGLEEGGTAGLQSAYRQLLDDPAALATREGLERLGEETVIGTGAGSLTAGTMHGVSQAPGALSAALRALDRATDVVAPGAVAPPVAASPVVSERTAAIPGMNLKNAESLRLRRDAAREPTSAPADRGAITDKYPVVNKDYVYNPDRIQTTQPPVETAESLPISEPTPAPEPVVPPVVGGETTTPWPEAVVQDETSVEPAPIEPDKGPVGIKNAFSAEQRRRLDMPERETPETLALEEMYDAGKKAAADDPELIDRVVEDLRQNPERQLTWTESSAMVKDATDRESQLHELNRERDAAKAAGDIDTAKAVDEQIARHREVSKERIMLYEQAGTAGGRGLVVRRLMSNLDYSLNKMTYEAESAKGDALTEEEHGHIARQHADIKTSTEQLQTRLEASKEKDALTAAEKTIAELTQEVDRLKKEATPANVEQLKREPGSANVRAPARQSRVLAKINAAANEARARIKKRGTRLHAGLDPIEIADYAIIGASHIANGVAKFASWSAKMVVEFGEGIRPHLQEIFDASQVQLTAEQKTDVRVKMKERAAQGEAPEKMRPYFREIALDIIRSGTTAREDVVTKLHEQVVEDFPNLSREQVRDILSGYGDLKKLDPENAKRQLREISSELQKVAQLEALEKGKAPLASGMERQPLTPAGRILQKKVNDAKKKAGIKPVQGPGHLKSALESAKTRIRNQIGDLQTEIDTGQRLIRGKPERISDAELETLKTQLSEFREQHAAIFKPGLSDEQRLALATMAAQRTAEHWKTRLADARSGKFGGAKNTPRSNAAIDAIRAQSEAARLEVERLRALDPAQKASDEAKSNAAYRARLEERRADILDRIARGDFKPRQARPERMLDAETHRLRTSVEAAKRRAKTYLQNLERANETTGQKVMRGIGSIPGLTKSLKTAFDLSAIFRQGWGVMMTNPAIWAQNSLQSFADAWQQFGGKEVMDGVRAETRGSRHYHRIVRGKLDVDTVEEAYPSSLPERIPLIGRAFKVSQVVYTAFLQRVRVQLFEKMLDSAKASGIDIDDPVQIRSIARVVNSLTGRGDLGKGERVADILNNIFFSPRKLKGDLDVLTAHAFNRDLSGFARIQALKNLGKMVAGNTMLLIIANAIDPDSVEEDPRSADFGKIRSGDTRFDVTGGRASLAVLASRLAALVASSSDTFRKLDSFKSSTTGKMSQINSGKFGALTGTDLLTSFAANKLSPIASVVNNHLRGQRFGGDKPTVGSDAVDLLVPMAAANLVELMQDRGATVVSVATGAIADFFGIGTNTYSGKNTNNKN